MKNGCERTKNRMQTKLQPLGMDHLFIYLFWGGGGGWAITQKNSCTEKVDKKNHAQWAKGKKSSKPFYSWDLVSLKS